MKKRKLGLNDFDRILLKLVTESDPFVCSYDLVVQITELRGMNYTLDCFLNHLWRGNSVSSETLRIYLEQELDGIKEIVGDRKDDIIERMLMAREAYEHKHFLERGEEPKYSIAELKEMPYTQYLTTSHWRELSTWLKTELKKCQLCGARRYKLQVHHNTYENLGNEPRKDLIVLCSGCHDLFHGYSNIKKR